MNHVSDKLVKIATTVVNNSPATSLAMYGLYVPESVVEAALYEDKYIGTLEYRIVNYDFSKALVTICRENNLNPADYGL